MRRSAADAVAHQLPIPIGLFGGPADEPWVPHQWYARVRPWVRNPPLRWHVRGQRCHVLSINALVVDQGKPFGWDIMVRPSICSFDLLTGALWPPPHTTYSQEKAAAHAVAPFWESYKTFDRCEEIVPGKLQHFLNAPPKRLPAPPGRGS
ncbi:hypothetical protein [Gemmata obscuriglobus]|uniref:hypothetical protein n=1 Tax=Gemmata obscuriglobus TaxID=114 RepID=UPI00016C3CE7|nr:hypothetical protein [Gemmata obscuriglobus]